MKVLLAERKKMIRYVLLLLVILLGWSLQISAQSDYKLAEQDSLALVAFYWATDGPNWTSNQPGFGFDDLTSEWQVKYFGGFNNWFDGPVKNWFGVQVEKRPIENSVDSTYRVTWLWPVIGRRTDGQNLLDGYVPREIGLMTALEQFRVNGNDGFRDELIPDEIYHTSLEHFDTEAAWFGGGLSDALRNCLGIRKLNVRYNNYDYMPNMDFLDEAALRNMDGTQWFYNSRFSYFYMERIIDYFYTISPNLKEFGFEARDMFDVGDEIEIVAPVGTSVEMICNDAGSREEDITYQWYKGGLSKFGKKNKTYTFSSVSANDYGHYTTRITNEYVKAYDQNGNYGEVFTKEIHLVAEPVAPIIERGVVNNNGQYIDLYFSKPMTGSTGYTDLMIQTSGQTIEVASAEVRGRLNRNVRLHLVTPIRKDEMVSLSSTSDAIKDANGGVLEAISNLGIENRTRVAPAITEAITTLDGSGIIIRFDQYIDAASLASANFAVEGVSTYSVSSTTLMKGVVDDHISKNVLLTLAQDIVDSSEVITIQYMDGQVAGLYAGSAESSMQIAVLNRVTVDKTDVKFRFEDGSESLNNILIQASWKVDPIQLYDDGTNGDELADDHIWTYQASLVDDDYSWDVISREELSATDTVRTVDSLGNDVLTLVPITTNVDSILSGNILLGFSVFDDVVTGDTIYGIQNRDVIFNVKINGASEDIYLMGLDGDWTNGQLMPSTTTDTYSYTLPKLTAGDVLEYNYRRGNNWENETPAPRSYIVKNGENIINDEFGVFTSIEELDKPILKLYPNPSATGLIQIEYTHEFETFEIYTATGQLIQQVQLQSQSSANLDLSRQAKGLYFLIGISRKGKKYSYKILLQ